MTIENGAKRFTAHLEFVGVAENLSKIGMAPAVGERANRVAPGVEGLRVLGNEPEALFATGS